MDDKTKLSAKEKEIVDRDIERWSLYPGDRTAVYAACEAVLASRAEVCPENCTTKTLES
jgi:hypothetical protein